MPSPARRRCSTPRGRGCWRGPTRCRAGRGWSGRACAAEPRTACPAPPWPRPIAARSDRWSPGRLDLQRVDDPERLVLDPLAGQRLAQRKLALRGRRGQGVVHGLAAGFPVLDGLGLDERRLVFITTQTTWPAGAPASAVAAAGTVAPTVAAVVWRAGGVAVLSPTVVESAGCAPSGSGPVSLAPRLQAAVPNQGIASKAQHLAPILLVLDLRSRACVWPSLIGSKPYLRNPSPPDRSFVCSLMTPPLHVIANRNSSWRMAARQHERTVVRSGPGTKI